MTTDSDCYPAKTIIRNYNEPYCLTLKYLAIW